LPIIPNSWSREDVELCGVLQNNSTGGSQKLWCYCNKLHKQLYVALNDDELVHPAEDSNFECENFVSDWVGILRDGQDAQIHILLKLGQYFLEGEVHVPNIYKGISDESLDTLNEHINANYAIPFDSPLPLVHDNFQHTTKVQTKVCQEGGTFNNYLPLKPNIFEEYFMMGERVENCRHFTFLAQYCQGQVCLFYAIYNGTSLICDYS
jgi:hypothetical protein